MRLTRRSFLQAGLLAYAAPAIGQVARPRIIVIGGGFAGAMVARLLAQRGMDVALIEPSQTYMACPLSNAVLGGFRALSEQAFSYSGLNAAGVAHYRTKADAVDVDKRLVILSDATRLTYDRLIMAPGIDMNFESLPGYNEAASAIMPHAWKAGAQTQLLRDQLSAMRDGGTVAMVIPANPYRCPPGPYERASLIAWYLKQHKPKSKLVLFDAKDSFSKQKLFQSAWDHFYPGMIEWVPLSKGGKVIEVKPQDRELITEFGRHQVDVANIIPPQRAGAIAMAAGITDRSGWCPVHADRFQSTLAPSLYVIGDAAMMGAMPKSAFSGHMQAHACAAMIHADLKGEAPPAYKLINACYSLITPDYGISVSGVYRPQNGRLMEVEGAGGVSAQDAPAEARTIEARYAFDWFNHVTGQTYG